MVRIHRIMLGSILVAALLPWWAVAEEGEGPRNLYASSRLRLEYDNNVNQTESNKEDSFKIIEAIDLGYNLATERTFLSLRYQPSFVYWENRDDDTDFQHAFDGTLDQTLSPRLSLNFRDKMRLTERSETIDRASEIRETTEFIYNTAKLGLNYLVRENTRLESAVRYITLQYDQDAVAAERDYDILAAGLSLRNSLRPTTSVIGELRFEDLSYETASRDSETYYIGGGVDHTFNPVTISKLRVGYQHREFKSAQTDSTDSPYFEASMTYLPTPATRLTSGVSFSQYESNISPFASQERTRLFASLAHDVTAKISGFLTGAYTLGQYDDQETPEGTGPVPDGDEDTVQISARATYRVNMSNYLEVGWQFVDVSSDIRTEYSRNRINLGWVLKI